jgi:hypothetical protein
MSSKAGNHKQRKHAVVPKSVTKMKAEFEGMLEAKGALPFLTAMVDPMNSNPQRAPDMEPAATSVFSFPYAEQGAGCVPRWDYATGEGDTKQVDETVVYVTPGTQNNIWISKSDTDIYTADTNLGDWLFMGSGAVPLQYNSAANVKGINCSFLLRKPNIDIGTSTGASYNIDSPALGGIIPRIGNFPNAGFEEAFIYDFPLSAGVDNATIIQFIPCTGSDGSVGGAKFGKAQFYYRRGTGAWVPMSVWPTELTVGGGLQNIGMFGYSYSIPSAHDVTQIVFVPPDTYSDQNWMILVDTDLNQATFTLGGVPTHYEVSTFRDVAAVADPREARCTALSLLTTYMGNDVANGGVIASARLTPGTTPAHAYQGDMYAWIQTLPKSNYHGPLKEGSYVWWCPQSTREILPRSYKGDWDVYGEQTSLLTVFRRDSANDATYGLQNMRIMIQQHTEVWNDSNLYEHEIRPYVAYLEKMLHVLVQQTAATENATHLRILQRLKKGLRALVTNPENWKKLLTWTGRTVFNLPI